VEQPLRALVGPANLRAIFVARLLAPGADGRSARASGVEGGQGDPEHSPLAAVTFSLGT